PRFLPCTLPSSHGRTLPLGALGICFSHGAPASLCSVERGADLPMGRAPDSLARSDFVFGSRTQSDFRSAAADLRRSSSLLLQAYEPHAANRTTRHPATRKESTPSLILPLTGFLPTSSSLLSLIRYPMVSLGVLIESPMASLTASPRPALPLPSATIRIEPPHGFFELRLREVWAYRELLYFFVWRDVKIRYKQTAIGVLWVILQPVLNMLVFTLFFGRLAKLPSDGLPYPVFYFAALVPWTYFSYSLSSTTNVVVENQRLITKVYFPRLILPISSVLSGLVDFAIGFVVLSIFCFAYGILPTFAALWLPGLLLLALFTALGVGLWLSALNALYRDVRYVISFVVQF